MKRDDLTQPANLWALGRLNALGINLMHHPSKDDQSRPAKLRTMQLRCLPGLFRAACASLLCAGMALCGATLGAQTAIPANAQLVAPSAIPQFGTFFSLYKTKEPPLPFLKPMYAEAGLPVYWLGGTRFLVADTSLDWAAIEAERRLLHAAASALSANSASQLDGGGAGLMGCSYSSNDLWLEITNVANGLAYANLHNGTNQVYGIWGTTNLATPFSLWEVETEAWPADTDCQPFTVLTLGRPDLFLRAQDWTGVDSDNDGIPDWWIWYYFGDLAHTAADANCQGGSLLYYYTNGLDPNPLGAASLDVPTCTAAPVNISLYGYGWALCYTPARGILYSILVPPQHGTLTGMPGPDGHYVYSPTNADFTGTDSFGYLASIAWGGNSATGLVNIVVGDTSLCPNSQTALTGTNQPVALLLTSSGGLGCSNLTYTITSGPTNGELAGLPPNVLYTPHTGFEGADHFSFTVSNGVWGSACEDGAVTLYVVAGPNLTAQCRSDRIILNWSFDSITQQLLANNALSVYDFRVFRSTAPGNLTTNDLMATVVPYSTHYYDTTVASGVTYYYAVTFRYQDAYTGIIYASPLSNVVPVSTCQPPYEGPMDVAFIIDNTGSMQASLAAIKQSVSSVLNEIATASSNDFRLAIVTPDTDNDANPTNFTVMDGTGHDMVYVRLAFTNNAEVFSNVLNSIAIGNGVEWPESTDECLNTVVNALMATGRQDTNQCAATDKLLQLGDFAPNFRANAVKRVVLITDAIPGGFCDSGNTQAQAEQYATEARAKGITINTVEIFNANNHQDTMPVMQDYSMLTCGWYWLVPSYSDAQGIQSGIVSMLYIPSVCN